MRMLFRFADGVELVVRGENEGMCIAQADEHTEEHGAIAFYSEVEEDSIFYGDDGLYE